MNHLLYVLILQFIANCNRLSTLKYNFRYIINKKSPNLNLDYTNNDELIVDESRIDKLSDREINIVILHLEKFSERYNLLHIGISFNNSTNIIRYDFRPYNYNKTYQTSKEQRNNITLLFPDNQVDKENEYIYSQYRNLIFEDQKNIYAKDIYWGTTNKTQDEILKYEKDILINKRYRVGIYDCRHFVRDYAIWCLHKPTPIWRLKYLWNNN